MKETTCSAASLDLLLSLALDLTTSLTGADRQERFVAAVHRAIPADAVALLRLEGDVLVPAAAQGLGPDVVGRRFPRAEHPRLEAVCASAGPVLFPPDSALPDPFDGLLASDPHALATIHACLGCPLRVEGQLVGALTADARAPGAFDGLEPRYLEVLAALAGAALRVSALIERLERDATQSGLVAQDLMQEARERRGGHLVGKSEQMARLREEVRLVAASDMNVLITGETGVGKELVARGIHAASQRRERPLIYVNCAALPESVAESELFGHVAGAFTGATSTRPGKFEVANHGTLFLDEIGELPPRVQPLLLRALQEGEIQRVGADELRRVDVRVVAATNRDLAREVEAGRFRRDLFHRLDVFHIQVPPLRERREDIPVLAGLFCDLSRRRLGLGPVRLRPDALAALEAAAWPGNVRELENAVSRAVLRASARVARGAPVVLAPEHLTLAGDAAPEASAPPPECGPALRPGQGLREALDDYQRELIRAALEANDGNYAAAARALGVQRGNLHRTATRLGLRGG
ncbi:MAG: nitric oxide reductase transcriptional regulator NorR [Planctomycetota bacterium]